MFGDNQISLTSLKEFLLHTNRGRLLIGFVLISIALILVYLVSYSQTPKVLKVSPADNKVQVPTNDSIEITLDREVPPSVSLTSEPQAEFELIESTGRKLVFRPRNDLNPETKYKLSLKSEGETLSSFSFTTFSILDKLKASAPFKFKDFDITYQKKVDKFFVYIKSGDFVEGQKRVFVWFSEQGVQDPNSLPVSFFPPPGSLPKYLQSTGSAQ